MGSWAWLSEAGMRGETRLRVDACAVIQGPIQVPTAKFFYLPLLLYPGKAIEPNRCSILLTTRLATFAYAKAYAGYSNVDKAGLSPCSNFSFYHLLIYKN